GTALGGRTFKLRFGHHGGNQPIRREDTGGVEIASHNHNYAMEAASLPGVEITHVNLNDHTVGGLRDRGRWCFGVQYHPEAGPGPHDPRYLFDEFAALMDEFQRAGGPGAGPIVATDFGAVELTHWNLNDRTLEGLRCLDVPAFGVQYHPEAAPGPHDSQHLFEEFRDLIAHA
ncbi:MAG TPA: hypothetical protein VF029_06400, partial [Actinomycetota bacterium]